MIAFHSILIREKKKISHYASLKEAITNLDTRVDTSRGSTSPKERQKNIDVVRGLILPHVVESNLEEVYDNHSIADIDAIISRSQIEHSSYELKQGFVTLGPTKGSPNRTIDENVFSKVINTICAIANNGRSRSGTVIIGIADKDSAVHTIERIDGIKARPAGERKVVGVRREAAFLGISIEDYFAKWKNAIRDSELSEPLRSDVLSSINYHDYFGYGLVIIPVPAQKKVSQVGSKLFMRSGDDTKEITDFQTALTLNERFLDLKDA